MNYRGRELIKENKQQNKKVVMFEETS